jgi:hypothetical protein
MAAAASPHLRWGWWLLIAALGAVELAIAGLTLVPRESAAYSAYYVTHEAACYLDDGLPRVEPGRTVGGTRRYGINRCLFDDAWRVGRSGTLLQATSGELAFRLAEAPEGEQRLNFAATALGRFGPVRVAVSADETELGTVVVSRDPERVYSVAVPPEAFEDTAIHLKFSVEAGADDAPAQGRLKLLRWRLDPASAPMPATVPPAGYF